MGAPYASVADLVARWRPLTATEIAKATVLLEDASEMIRAEFPTVDERIAADPQLLSEGVPKMVACAMVKRSMLSGDDAPAAESLQQTAGPFSQSVSFKNPTGDLYIATGERRMLRPGANQAFTIGLTVVSVVHLPWCASMFGALYCSCGADIAGTPIFEGGEYY